MAAQIQLDPDRFDRPKGARELMRDGAWLVPPKDRPKGWERMGLEEPKEVMATLPVIKLQESAQKPNPYANRQTSGKWDAIIERGIPLEIGASFPVVPPPDIPVQQYKNQLRSILTMRTRFRWSVTGNGLQLTIKKIGLWPTGEELLAQSQKEAEEVNTLPTATKRRVEETQTTTVHRAITETVEERVPKVKPKPKPLPNALKELPPAGAVPAIAQPVKPDISALRINEEASFTGRRIIDLAVRIYGPEDEYDEEEFEELMDLGERLYAERCASRDTETWIQVILSEGGALDEATESAVRMAISGVCTERRLLELSVLSSCKDLYRRGNPCQCDHEAKLLPPEDRDRLEKAKAEIDKEARAAKAKAKAAVSSNSGSTPK